MNECPVSFQAWDGVYEAPLFARVEGEVVHGTVVLCPDVVQASVVSKSSPLHVDTHLSLIALNHLNVLHLFHVTRITASAYNQRGTLYRYNTKKLNIS